MNKFLALFIGLVVGLVLGGVLTFYYFVGAPTAAQVPGEPIRTPDPSGLPAGTTTVVLDQQFLDTVLQTIFKDMNAPVFPFSLAKQETSDEYRPTTIAFLQSENTCESKITLLPTGSGVTTSVRLENEKISSALAFSGNANVFGNCVPFSGWAQAGLSLYYEAEQKNVYGKINVETVNLDGVTPLASGLIGQLVQNSLNQRVNPIPILKGKQIAFSLPIAATDSTLNANIKDVRAEVKDSKLSLFVSYDFSGTKGLQTTQ